MPNQLLGESSRYLQQHADNPVDWYPWGDAALKKALREDKPIFLSIGYSACHWCHVMAHESFEDAATAEILNTHFVSIKVDREERPDLDRIYMGAVQAMTGGGGWPMSVFITPEGTPFYGGTYFPKEPRYNMPAFSQLLQAIADGWQNRRGELLKNSDQLIGILRQQHTGGGGATDVVLDPTVIETAYQGLRGPYDARQGGWGSAPKFPQPMVLEFLLRYHHTTGDRQSLAMVTQTLEAMARGGIYDQLGGGFHRYSVDAHWLTPHFEKMLYDNAQLARVYLHAWQLMHSKAQVTNGRSHITEGEGPEELLRAVVEETLDYVMREMTAPEGGFYATQDADSEGEEGKFFTWTPREVRDVLGGPATRFLELYGVTEKGNFEGKNILTFTGTFEERQAIAGACRRLFESRKDRTHPGRDEKVLTSWNGLMLAAFAEAASVLDREDYRRVAERNADFLLRELRTAEGRLFHVWHTGEAGIQGLLEDYTYLIEGLLALYQTTFEPRWVVAATELADEMIAHFGARSGDGEQIVGFYDTADDGGRLVVRPREIQDNAVPSGNAMAATVLQKLSRLSGETHYEDISISGLASMQSLVARHPLGFGQWLVALDLASTVPVDVAIVGDPEAAGTRALIAAARAVYAPQRLFAVGAGSPPELLAHREQVEGLPTAYVCRNSVCLPPVTEPNALRDLLL